MNELQVIVQQTPGVISWNFEELKAALRERLDEYKKMVYDDSSIKTAKDDLAMLRKLRKAVEDKRKEIKNDCLKPYNDTIEPQAGELTALIDEPIELIDKRVKEFEAEQKSKRKQAILAYMSNAFAELPAAVAKKAEFKVYDTRWENATAKEKDWKAAIDAFRDDVKRSLDVIEGVDEEFREEARSIYAQNLELSAAMSRVQDLQAQKQRILEAERQRQEAEERRKADEARQKAEAEARRKAEEAAAAAAMPAAAPTACQPAKPVDVWGDPGTPIGTPVHIPGNNPPIPANWPERMPDTAPEPATGGNPFVEDDDPWTGAQAADTAEATREPEPQQPLHIEGTVLLRIYGTEKEQQKVLDYLGFLGVKFDTL